MDNLHIIWKYRKLISFFILATGNAYSAECKKINDGVYVQDLSFEGLKDGGRISRVLRLLDPAGLNEKYLGTTGQFSSAIVVRNNMPIVYGSIGNSLDEAYETLAIAENAVLDTNCNGNFKITYSVTKYYHDAVKIGGIPNKKSYKIQDQERAELEGKVLEDGSFKIEKCTSYDFEINKWLKTKEDRFYLCNNSEHSYKMFNIFPYLAGKKGWESARK